MFSYAYNATHSLIIYGAVFFLLWSLLKSPPWLMAPWALHIVCDIPRSRDELLPDAVSLAAAAAVCERRVLGDS